MANIFRVYKDSQVTTDRIRAEAAADSIVTPERVVYVFGTADDVAPNFTTVAGAITYANSLLPNEDNPVVVRLFVNDNNEPYTLAGLSSWTTYANIYIYFVSDFVRLNKTTTLPTTLPVGAQVWYIDPNGVETLWVGREDGSAQLVGAPYTVATFTPTFNLADTGTITTSTVATVTNANGVIYVDWSLVITPTTPSGAWTITNIPTQMRPQAGQVRILLYKVGSNDATVRIGMLSVFEDGSAQFDTDGASADGESNLSIFGSYAL
jgi:hypothetical protein